MNKKVIAVYYPQFHSIKENDRAWGKGFTDWDRVKSTNPLFEDHYQPREPLNEKYYDLTNPETIAEQVELAQKYGIHGFCFYHYWFDGKLLLEKPLELFFKNTDLKMPFCLSWANETWTKRWVGDHKSVIQKQTHHPDKETWKKHFEYLLPMFLDDRYIKIDKKPVFLFYQPSIITNLKEMMVYWQELALSEGLNGIYFVATKRQKNVPQTVKSDFDAVMKYQPQEAYNCNNFGGRSVFSRMMTNVSFAFPEHIRNKVSKIKDKAAKLNKFDSQKLWDSIIKNAYKPVNEFSGKIFESIYVNWDNTPRYGSKGNVFSLVEPLEFEHYLSEMFKKMDQNNAEYIFVNAWNEWAEGAYLEPDKKYGYQYLEAIYKSLNK